MAAKKRQPKKRPTGGPTKSASNKSSSPDQSGPRPKGGATASKQARREAARRKAELKRKGSWAVVFVGVAVVLGIIGLSIRSSVNSANAGVATVEAWEIPPLYDGGDITLASYSGKPVVVNFFASWCAVCEDELPDFKAAVEQFGEEVQFVFVDSQDTDRLGKRMAEDFGIDTFTVGKDFGASNAAFFRALGGRGMPITAFYDAEGSLDFVAQGGLIDGAIFEQLRRFGYIS